MSRSIIKTAGVIGLLTGLIALIGFLLLGLSHELLMHQKALSVMDVSSHKNALMYWRFLLYAMVIACWPITMKSIGKRQQWSEDQVNYMSKQYLLVLLFFILTEIFFVYNILGHVFSAI